jgi:hypothetical protein
MEALFSRLLSNVLGDYVKGNVQFSNWKLKDIELKENVIQQLFSIPSYFELMKATCSEITVTIPWASLYSGTEPIVLRFERIEIFLEEPVVVLAASQRPPPPPPPPTVAQKESYLDRLIDGIKVSSPVVVVDFCTSSVS